ncbi:peptide ABC transporter substrate-binding protein [Actinopolyspora sp. H202]|uniref:peptide ABC transporter substrate-binding protein n=1 Tax=Actinopolyspora sp. H202 TaxID=1500456 RepID=UPI003EE80390
MRKRRMVAPVAASLSAVLLAAGCGGGGGSAVTEETGTLKDPITVDWGEPENPLVPGNTTEVNGGNVLDAMFTGLVEYDPKTFEPYNAMAKSIEASDDKKTYTVKLKQGWKFHDGEEVTADNFVRAWNYTSYAPNGQKTASFFDKIKGFDDVNPPDPDGETGPKEAPEPSAEKMSGLKVVDDHTFEITLKQPFTIFPTTLGYTAFSPLPEKFFKDKEAFENDPVGNGPYKFEKRQPNRSLTLTRYEDYKGERKGEVKAFKFKVYQKQATAYRDLKSGNLDFQRQVPTSALVDNRWKEELGDNALTREGALVTPLSFPLYDEKFQDPNLRKAISMAIDRESIVKNVFSGTREALRGWSAPGTPGREGEACGQWCQYDPAKAKELLKKAGGFDGTLTISSNADGGHEEWIKAVAGSIRDTLGIEVSYNPVPTFSEFRSSIAANQMTGMFRSGWIADYPSIQSYLAPIYTKGGSSNDSGYYNPKFEDLMSQANQAPTVEKANELYAKAEKLLAKDMPTVPVYSQNVQSAKSDRIAEGQVTKRRSLSLTSVKIAQPE